jgi:hypothetical protein
MVQLLFAGRKHVVELLGLRDCARETIEDEAVKGTKMSASTDVLTK